jgi:sugar phosphate isomerase/epimerase
MTNDGPNADVSTAPRTAIQLYSIREIEAPFSDVLSRVGATRFDGVEFAHRFLEADVDQTAAALHDAGLDVAGAHVGLERAETHADTLSKRYHSVGTVRAVLPHVEASHFEDEGSVRSLTDRLNDVARHLAARDLELHYHNQDHEFARVGDRTGFDMLAAATDPALVGFELDVGGAVAAGADPVALLEQYGDRISLVHVKDVSAPAPAPGAGQDCVPIGTGDVDVPAVVRAARSADVEWLIFENDEPENATEALERGAEVLSDAVATTQNR